MKTKSSNKKKYLILGTIGGGVLAASVTTPIIILNNKNDKVTKEDKVINKIVEILKNKSTEEKIIVLPSDAKGKIIADNKEKIIEKIKILIGKSNLKEVKIEILMTTDAPISTISQDIIVSISKIDKKTIKTTEKFQVKRELTNIELIDKDIESIKTILDSKIEKDLIITLPSDSSGKIIGKIANKNAIERELRKLIDPLNTNGEASHASLKGTTIEVSKSTDKLISTFPQDIIVKISKGERKTLTTTNTFQVKREFTNVEFIKNILDSKTRDDLIISLPSDASGNIISKAVNKNAIEKELRKLIDSSNTNGEASHASLKGTRISVSMSVDAPISRALQNIIVTISKNNEKTLTTRKIFRVKRKFNTNENILAIKTILEAKTGDDLIISLPSNASGNIIGKRANKNAIEKELRKLIDPSNTNGEASHASLRETTISVSIKTDLPISTTAQNIIVSISKTGGTTLKISNTFQVRRKFTIEEINDDITSIKKVLDSKSGDDLTIILPSYSNGSIIKNIVNKNKIKQELRKLIDPSNLYGEANHPSLRGTTIDISMSNDAPISTTAQNIIVSISKTGGATLNTSNTFQVKRELTNNELIDKDIESIKTILEAKTGNDLIITLPSNSNRNIIRKRANKNAIERELRKLIDPSNTNGDSNHPSLKGTKIVIYMDVDAPISTKPQNIIVTIKKLNKSHVLTKNFQVKRKFTTNELINKDIESIKTILEAKTGNDLIITLPSDSSGNIIGEITNKNEIQRKLRILIDPLNINGETNHQSLMGTTIEVSMNLDAPISTIPQNIIVKISKADGTILKIMNIFQVKRAFTNFEDVLAIQKILDSKTGNDLIITLPSVSNGNIISELANKNAIEKELRKLIDPSNINGDVNHPSLRGTTIEVSMEDDAPISTISQNIIVSINKIGVKALRTTRTFQVNKYDSINEDIASIKKVLDSKSGDDLIIILPSDSNGNIINNLANKNTIEKELRKLIDPSNINGDVNHPSLRGTTIEVSMEDDAPISTILQNIIVSINKIGGKTLSTTKTFQVVKHFTTNEDIASVKKVLDSKSGDDLIIILPSDSSGNIINNLANKNTIEKELRKLIDPSNINGDVNHPSLRGTTIEVSMEDDAPISTILQNIIVSINKSGGKTLSTTKTFQVKRAFTNAEKITNYFANTTKKRFTIFGGEALNTKLKILTAIKKHLAQDDPNLWTNVVQSLISVDSDETTNEIVKENYHWIRFSIVYQDDNGIIQNVELRFRHLRTKMENKIIVDNLYDYYKNKWNTRAKALTINMRFLRWWTGKDIRKAINDATKNIYFENKVLFDVKKIFHVNYWDKDFFIIEKDTRNIINNYGYNLEKAWRFEIVLYSGKGKKVSWRKMIIFIKAIKKTKLTTSQLNANKDIMAVRKILDSKSGDDLIITIPSDSNENIIKKWTNKNAIIKKLVKLIDPSNIDGDVNHPSLRRTKIEVSMDDAPISTKPQNIIVSISKMDGTTLSTTKTFQVKREFTTDEDIIAVRKILDSKSGDDLIITLPNDSDGNIIGKATNKNAIIEKLMKLIDPLNTNGNIDHPSLRGTSIEVSMGIDSPISTTAQDIIVSISKTDGTTLKTTSIFQVKRKFTIDEDILAIKEILDSKSKEDLIITLPSDSTGNIIGKATNKNAIIKKLRILIDPLNTNGIASHASLRGTTIQVSMNVDSPISTTLQNIVVSISKTNGIALETTSVFQVKRKFTDIELNANEDIMKIKEILDSKSKKDLIITLPSDSTGNIIGKAANKNAIIKKLRILIDPLNTNGIANHASLRGTTIQVLMDVDGPISTTLQNIVVSISKTNGITLETRSIFQVKRKFTIDEDILAIKEILDSKSKEDLIITLPSDSIGNIIGKATNKNAIIKKLRILIDPSNTNGIANHTSLRGTTIQVSIDVDGPISTTLQNIIVSISKTNGITLKTTSIFKVKRKFNDNEVNANEDIASIKSILDSKTGENLIITLPSGSSGNIVEKESNKNAIEKQLRKLIDPLNTNGIANHASLRGTTIEVSMDVDGPISTTLQNIIVSISKTYGTTLTTSKTFQVKRDFTTSELNANEDIMKIKEILDSKSKEDLIITLMSDSTGNIIGKVANKNAIIKKLRILIDPSNTNGEASHASLRGTTIEVSMDVDGPISTTTQNVIVSISKTNGTTLSTSKIFQVKRDFTANELNANEDIMKIKEILDSKSKEDLIITLPSDSDGNIIGKAANKNAIIKKLRILIDPSNTNGEASHASLRGTTIELSMDVDGPISTTLQNIIVSISKTNGITLETTSTFQVKRKFTISELANKDIESIKRVFDFKTGEDLIITLPSDSDGNIIGKAANKNAIIKKLRILIDPSNTNGEASHRSLRGTTIEVSMDVDGPISTTLQNIIVSISKTNGITLETTSTFQVKRKFTISELANKDIESIKRVLDSKSKEDLIITLSSDSDGNIIGKKANKNAIIKELRKLIDPLNDDGNPNHASLRGTTIQVSMDVDGPISTTAQNVIISITKIGGDSLTTSKIFQVKRDFTASELSANEDIMKIKEILDSKSKEDLIITLSSDSDGNIIGKKANKNAIIKELRKLIDPLNTNGEANHASLRGTTIEVSMGIDLPISTTLQNIVVSISKTNGITLETTSTFQVKRKFTISELANKDIEFIKRALDSKIGEDLKIILSSDSTGNIIRKAANKNAIIKKLRILIDPSNTNGEASHVSLRGTTIELSMDVDGPISTIFQNIIVTINKIGGNPITTTKTFKVKRKFTIYEINEDIMKIKEILDSKSKEDLIIILSSDSVGNIIGKVANKNAVIKELRKLIDPLNTNGEANHASLRGTTIEISMDVDGPISPTLQKIIVLISKTGGRTLTTRKTFKVKRDFTPDEDIRAIWDILESKKRTDLSIILPSDSSGNIVDKLENKNAIERKIRMVIDPSNTNGDSNHPSLRGTTITLRGALHPSDSISKFWKFIAITISKTGGTSEDFYRFSVKKLTSKR